MTGYQVAEEDISTYQERIIPYWQGRSMRERISSEVPDQWRAAYEVGLFTEFMEQRAPGHTALDGSIYESGMVDYKARIGDRIARLDYQNDPKASDRFEQLQAMDISCDAAIIFAERHALLAESMAAKTDDQLRKKELLEIGRICRKVPAHKPETFHQALQMYWFVHLGTITELNG